MTISTSMQYSIARRLRDSVAGWLPAVCLMALVLLGLPHAQAQDWTVNLKETDIQELIKFVAEATDTTIVVDPKVKGTVKVVSSKPVSSSELYDLFLSILDVHGYTAVRSGNVVRVIQSKDARSSPVRVEAQQAPRPSDEYVTHVIRLENISAAKLIPVLRPLVPQQAHMAAYAPSNAIIISDLASNIERIREIIESMDKSAVQQTEIVSLEYAVAEDVVRMLLELAKTEAKQAGGADPEILLVADKRTNSVLVSGDELERARMKKLIQFLDTPLEQSGNVKVLYLEYANATEIAEVLTRVMQNISKLDPEEKGRSRESTATIEADEGTNALIITADTDEMQSLEAVIQRLDIRRAQVLVEAIIAELELIDGQDLGIQWLFRNSNGSFGSNIVSGNNRAQGIADGLFPDDGTDGEDGGEDNGPEFSREGLLSALANTPGLSLGWGELDDDLDIAIILSALTQQTNANILSTPSLLTLDNQEAFITVGQEVPFVTGSFTSTGNTNNPNNPFQTIERENVGITLTVTPHVNEGDLVQLDISQEVSSLTGGGVAASLLASDIITNERRVETKVLAGDGRTVVLGGLIENELQDQQQKVPFLGDIPWLGRLFRQDAESITQSNLLVFIKPTIIRDDEALDGATAAKYKYIRAQQQMRIDAGLQLLDESDVPVLPEWEEQIKQLREIKEESAKGAAAAEAGRKN